VPLKSKIKIEKLTLPLLMVLLMSLTHYTIFLHLLYRDFLNNLPRKLNLARNKIPMHIEKIVIFIIFSMNNHLN